MGACLDWGCIENVVASRSLPEEGDIHRSSVMGQAYETLSVYMSDAAA